MPKIGAAASSSAYPDANGSTAMTAAAIAAASIRIVSRFTARPFISMSFTGELFARIVAGIQIFEAQGTDGRYLSDVLASRTIVALLIGMCWPADQTRLMATSMLQCVAFE